MLSTCLHRVNVLWFGLTPMSSSPSPSQPSLNPTGLPPFLTSLLSTLSSLLAPVLPPDTHALLFSPSPSGHTGPPARAKRS